jgi:hypothetical protein
VRIDVNVWEASEDPDRGGDWTHNPMGTWMSLAHVVDIKNSAGFMQAFGVLDYLFQPLVAKIK